MIEGKSRHKREVALEKNCFTKYISGCFGEKYFEIFTYILSVILSRFRSSVGGWGGGAYGGPREKSCFVTNSDFARYPSACVMFFVPYILRV